MTKTSAIPLAALLAWSLSAQAGVVREDIIFLAGDGQHFTAYKTLRSDLAKRQVTLDANERKDDLLYFHPDDFTASKVKGRSVLSFDNGSYALMRAGRFSDKKLKQQKDGSYQFDSWDGQVLASGHYGKWNSPDPFERFSYVWVLPDNMEILAYNTNEKGQWRQRGNTLAWSGKNVNDLTFRIKYRVTSQPSLALDLSKLEKTQNAGELTRITLDSGSLFPSGSHRFTPAGESLLTTLADKLSQRDSDRIIVEGHTDNQPLKPYLQDTYPSNWELSAARATIVVRWLAEHGVNPEILEARAYGEQRPVADNETAQGRAKNRRIEILVGDKDVGAGEPEPAAAAQTSGAAKTTQPEVTRKPGKTAAPPEKPERSKPTGFTRGG